MNMESNYLNEAMDRSERTHRISWLSLAIAALIWMPVSYLKLHFDTITATKINAILLWGLPFLAFILGMLSLALRIYLFSDQRIISRLSKQPNLKKIAKKQNTGEIDKDRLKEIESLSSMNQRLLVVLHYIFTVFLICWSLNNSISFIGLLFSILTRSFLNIFSFQIAALILNLIMFPRPRTILERAKRLGLVCEF